MNKEESNKDYCGIIFIGGGSSYAYADSPAKAAKLVAKTCRQDWKHLYRFKRKHHFIVNIYDTADPCTGWVSDVFGGVRDIGSGEDLLCVETVEVEV